MARKKKTPISEATLQALAEEHGYMPGDVTVERLASTGSKLRSWAKDIDRGFVPEELGHLPEKQARALVFKELNAFVDLEQKMLPYFYPTMQRTEAKVKVKGEVTLIDLLKASGSDT